MGLMLTVHFNDEYVKSFTCDDDEDATMKREELLEVGYEEKEGNSHVFYPVHSISKIVVTQDQYPEFIIEYYIMDEMAPNVREPD